MLHIARFVRTKRSKQASPHVQARNKLGQYLSLNAGVGVSVSLSQETRKTKETKDTKNEENQKNKEERTNPKINPKGTNIGAATVASVGAGTGKAKGA